MKILEFKRPALTIIPCHSRVGENPYNLILLLKDCFVTTFLAKTLLGSRVIANER